MIKNEIFVHITHKTKSTTYYKHKQLLNSYPLLIHDQGLICNVLIIDDMRHGDSSTRVVFSYFLISMN